MTKTIEIEFIKTISETIEVTVPIFFRVEFEQNVYLYFFSDKESGIVIKFTKGMYLKNKDEIEIKKSSFFNIIFHSHLNNIIQNIHNKNDKYTIKEISEEEFKEECSNLLTII